jgi:hypothetical protein
MEGSWDFIDLDKGVLVTHEIRIRPGFPVPRFLIRSVMKNTIPEMLACIRSLASGSISEARQATDAASCPGSPK